MGATPTAVRRAGQRELQRLETRRNLAEHAIRLFSERGFDQTTVEEIAAAAGVSTRTFFHHFPTKAGAAFPDHEERVVAFVADLHDGSPHEDPLLHLRKVILGTFETLSPSRLSRYALLRQSLELRNEDARTDRDYEVAISTYLQLHWGSEVEAVVRADAIANSVAAVVRAVMAVAAVSAIDARGTTAEILQRMFGAPFEYPLQSVK